MKSTCANAQENVSDEQLKDVTGGARVNPMPHAAEDHMIAEVSGPGYPPCNDPQPGYPNPGAPVVT